jgi:hypothetical protein
MQTKLEVTQVASYSHNDVLSRYSIIEKLTKFNTTNLLLGKYSRKIWSENRKTFMYKNFLLSIFFINPIMANVTFA